ncbi:MAG: phosphatase PAP2 family protein [Chloroflexota bacterium]|nr:phosphatase PAP2 family protein [Chloroflexota bacterium]
MKAVIHRGRPSANLVEVLGHPTSFSFPSGHVTEYTLVFGFSFYLAFTLLKPGLLRTLALVICGGMVLLVGISRIWEGNHWPTDVLGAYALSLGLLLLVIWGYRGWEERRVEKGLVKAQS